MVRSLRVPLLLALIASLLGSCVVDPDAARARRPIINGEIDETHTSVVALVALGFQFCSGTVIAPRAVLAAGHCVAETGYDATSMQVFFGTVVGQPGRAAPTPSS